MKRTGKLPRRLNLRRQFLLSCVEEVILSFFLVAVVATYKPSLLPWVGLGIGALFAAKFLLFPWRQPVMGPESMIGETAVVVEDLRPEGLAKHRGVLWVARSTNGTIRSGEEVKILEVYGSKILVSRKRSGGGPHRGSEIAKGRRGQP